MEDRRYLGLCLDEAKKSLEVGGIPIGACLVSKDGQILGQGHNRRIQEGGVLMHAETVAFEASNPKEGLPPPASVYEGATMYSTMLPCIMCTGACMLYKLGRVVYGTRAGQTAKPDTAEMLREHGIEVVAMDVEECNTLMKTWIEQNQERYKMEPWAAE